MRQIIKKFLPKNRFARSVSVLAGGAAAGQGIVVLSSPLLTRLYSPEDFGLLAVYASLLMTLGVVASLRYQLAIPLPEDDQEAANVVILSLLVVLGMSILSLIAVFFFRVQIAHLVSSPSLSNYLWLLPPGLFLLGTYQVFNYWALRVKAFTAIARTKLAQSISMVVVQIGGYAIGPVSLLIGQIAGQAAGSGSLGAIAIRRRWQVFRNVNVKDVTASAKRYRRFPIFSTWAGAFNSAGTQLPPLLFAALFNPAAAGLYMLAHRVLSMPMTLVGRAVGQVFFSTGAEASRNGNLGKLVSTLHNRLSQIAMPPALFLFITGPDIFALVFGEDWRMAGEAARWLSPMLYVQFIVAPLSQVNLILEKQIHGLVLQGILFVARIAGIVSAWILTENFITAVIFYGLGSFLGYTVFLLFIVYLSGLKISSALKPSLKNLPVSILLVIPVLLSRMLGDITILFNLSCVASFLLISLFYFHLFEHHEYTAI